MTVSTCPICKEPVRVPNRSVNTRLHCPICNNEFDSNELEPLLPTELPELGVVESAPVKASADDRPLLAELHYVPPKQEPQRASRNTDTDIVAVTTPRVSTSLSKNRRARERIVPSNDLRLSREIFKIGLGGLAGLCIAQLILWWLPGEMKRDPLNMAARLPESIAFLAPESLRSKKSLTDSLATQEDEDKLMKDAAVEPATFTQGDRAESLEKSDATSSSQTKKMTASATDSQEHSSSTEKAEEEESQVTFETRKVATELERAREDFDKFVSATDDTKNGKAVALYKQLCRLSYAVTYANPESAGIDETAEECTTFVRNLTADVATRKKLGATAPRWAASKRRTVHGIFLGGRVIEINEEGSLFHTVVEVYNRDKDSMVVASRIDPRKNSRTTYTVGDEIVVLGTLVANPNESKSQEQIVWGGLAVRIDEAKPGRTKNLTSVDPGNSGSENPGTSTITKPARTTLESGQQ